MKQEKKLKEVEAEIRRVSDAMKQFDKGQLKRRAVVLLLQDITGLNKTDITAVLDGLVKLADVYLKPEKPTKPGAKS